MGPTQPSPLNASDLSDDEIIMAQMQATINPLNELPQPYNTPEQKKRKSHHKAGIESDNRDRSARKKARAEKRALKALESLQDAEALVADAFPKIESRSIVPTSELQSVKSRTLPTVESTVKTTGFVRCPDKASALLQSILKDCTPNKVNQRRSMHSTIKIEEDNHVTTSTREAELDEKLVSILSFPVGYVPGPEGKKKRFECPVEGCSKKYSRRYTALEHLNTVHGDQQLVDNEDGTMSVAFADQVVRRASSIINSSAIHKIVKPESGDGANIPSKELFSGPEIRDIIVRPISASTVAVSNEFVQKPRASLQDTPGDEDDVPVGEERPLASVSRSESKNKKHQVANNSNGTQQDRTQDLYLHGAETVMDSWEVKPGLIRANRRLGGQGFEVEQDIAFSAVRIGSEPNGISLPGMEFQLSRLSAGTNLALASDTGYERICSVGSGKVQVSVGKKEFSIGAHGMWRIPSGVSCTAANRCYAEAVLHVCTMK